MKTNILIVVCLLLGFSATATFAADDKVFQSAILKAVTLRREGGDNRDKIAIYLGTAEANVPDNAKAKEELAFEFFTLGHDFYTDFLLVQPENLICDSNRKAAKYFRKAAELGLATAQFYLGRMYFYGYGVEKDELDAVFWFRKAAKQGEEEAIERLKSMGKQP